MGKHYPKMQCSITIATLSIFGAKTKIALTSKLKEPTFNIVTILLKCKMHQRVMLIYIINFIEFYSLIT